MRKIICTVPEQSLSTARILALEAAFRRAYAEHLGGDDAVTVLWYRLPPGQSYVAGAMEDVFLALIEVADGLDQGKREEVMMAFARIFSQEAEIPFEKPLVSVLDSSKVAEYLAANRNRLRWRSRLGFVVGTLLHAYRSRGRDGFASIRVNL